MKISLNKFDPFWTTGWCPKTLKFIMKVELYSRFFSKTLNFIMASIWLKHHCFLQLCMFSNEWQVKLIESYSYSKLPIEIYLIFASMGVSGWVLCRKQVIRFPQSFNSAIRLFIDWYEPPFLVPNLRGWKTVILNEFVPHLSTIEK